MFSIYDGRNKFYQWDKDRKLIVEDKTIKEVHFANCLCTDARVCEVREGLVDVPNELLTQDMDIRVWGYDGKMTKYEAVYEVERRTKPADYIYTPSEVWTAEKAVEEALEEAKANGDFKGDKGDKGDAGAINFVVVSELPESGSGDSIYLLPNATGENNNFDEYIFQNGLWEKIGSAGVEVNLDDYVKNTDYASQGKPGIVDVNPTDLGVGSYPTTGLLYLVGATEAQIDEKTHFRRPIMPNMLDYAVKSGLADSKLEWTDEEKMAALLQLGSDTTGTASYGLFPLRIEGGRIATAMPAEARHATNKKYVDDTIATAIDGVVAKKTSDRTSVYAVNNKGEQILVGTSPYACNNGMIPIYNQDGTLYVMTREDSNPGAATSKGYVEGLIANIESNIFVANPDTTWQEIDDAYNAGKYIFYAFDSWGIMNLIPLCQRGSNDVYIFTHIRENKYLYTVKVKKDNTRDIGSVYVVDKIDFDALVARVEALEGK
jgi:hypothetical protein